MNSLATDNMSFQHQQEQQQHRRGPWSQAEDYHLMSLVQTHGALNWVRIAATLGSRTPKQCRERYHQNLKPSLNHEPITAEEGAMIEQLVGEIGKRWAEIARRLNGRSDNAVKNWWNGSQNRRRRSDRRRAVQGHDDYYPVNRHGLSISTTPGLPMTGAQSSSLGVPPMRHPIGGWIEAPLPSPCSSESAESEAGSNYTTSPAHHSIPIYRPVELPPLRSSLSSQADPRLPSINTTSLASYGDSQQADRYGYKPTLPPPYAGTGSQRQLPTAPNSPVQQQFQPQSQSQSQSRPRSQQDSRMRLHSLLG
ncbi:myb-like dna-binding [Fusarium longipes]|uniref:Myb-like dna-binding n=1 Tax=Fusarium longipes TaxID=694270 RepID=A0A395RFJ8_9HYPO|nr:myb-like dna-binding [Fusarium longipes]